MRTTTITTYETKEELDKISRACFHECHLAPDQMARMRTGPLGGLLYCIRNLLIAEYKARYNNPVGLKVISNGYGQLKTISANGTPELSCNQLFKKMVVPLPLTV